MTAFLAEQCQNGSRDYRSGFLIFFEAPKKEANYLEYHCC